MLDSDDPALFLSRHGHRVRMAMRLLEGRAEAEDAVQDAYLRLLDRAAEGAAGIAVEQAWLTTVLQNLAIDRLRRRDWMRNWLAEAAAAPPPEAPSAEDQAALAQQTDRALLQLALRLDPHDGAALLLREVFEVGYREIAEVGGKTEAGCRQQVHRALLRLRQARDEAGAAKDKRSADEADAEKAALWQIYRQALAARDMRPLWAILRQAPARARSGASAALAGGARSLPGAPAPKAVCRTIQVAGQLGLVLSLGNQFICVLPLGASETSIDGAAPEHAGAEA